MITPMLLENNIMTISGIMFPSPANSNPSKLQRSTKHSAKHLDVTAHLARLPTALDLTDKLARAMVLSKTHHNVSSIFTKPPRDTVVLVATLMHTLMVLKFTPTENRALTITLMVTRVTAMATTTTPGTVAMVSKSVKNLLSNQSRSVKNLPSNLSGSLKSHLSNLSRSVKSLLSNLSRSLKSHLSNLSRSLKSLLSNVSRSVKNPGTTVMLEKLPQRASQNPSTPSSSLKEMQADQ